MNQTVIPCTAYQKWFWHRWKTSPQSTESNTPLVFHLEGDLQVDALYRTPETVKL